MFRLVTSNLALSSKVWFLGTILAVTPIVLTTIPLSSTAHEVEISGDVGGTMHIEPNDIPQAGGASLTWFSLNRRGGQPIRLTDCNCTLSVYTQPQRPNDSPIQQPTLSASTIEGHSGIPSANIIFPHPGNYNLVLQGQPVTASSFSPFRLEFSVTVAQ